MDMQQRTTMVRKMERYGSVSFIFAGVAAFGTGGLVIGRDGWRNGLAVTVVGLAMSLWSLWRGARLRQRLVCARTEDAVREVPPLPPTGPGTRVVMRLAVNELARTECSEEGCPGGDGCDHVSFQLHFAFDPQVDPMVLVGTLDEATHALVHAYQSGRSERAQWN